MPNTNKNKIIYNGLVLIDLTEDTVTPSTLMQGYTAHDKSGALITGTASGGTVTQDANGFLVLSDQGGGGGGSTGLVYESGTFTPSEDVAQPTISFTNTHTTPPLMILVADSTGTYSDTLNSNYIYLYSAINAFAGNIYTNTTTVRYAIQLQQARTSSTTALVNTTSNSPSAVSTVTSSDFSLKAYNSDCYWRSGRTYKWLAVWAPTS